MNREGSLSIIIMEIGTRPFRTLSSPQGHTGHSSVLLLPSVPLCSSSWRRLCLLWGYSIQSFLPRLAEEGQFWSVASSESWGLGHASLILSGNSAFSNADPRNEGQAGYLGCQTNTRRAAASQLFLWLSSQWLPLPGLLGARTCLSCGGDGDGWSPFSEVPHLFSALRIGCNSSPPQANFLPFKSKGVGLGSSCPP